MSLKDRDQTPACFSNELNFDSIIIVLLSSFTVVVTTDLNKLGYVELIFRTMGIEFSQRARPDICCMDESALFGLLPYNQISLYMSRPAIVAWEASSVSVYTLHGFDPSDNPGTVFVVYRSRA